MKTNLDHLPPVKQHELARVVEIILEEFENALKGASAKFKKRGRILKIILFGSYARGTFVDEPHTKKGYRSDRQPLFRLFYWSLLRFHGRNQQIYERGNFRRSKAGGRVYRVDTTRG